MDVTASNLQGSQGPNAEATKKRFVRCFTFLSVFEILLAIMMISVSSIAVSKYMYNAIPNLGPYFIGGFVQCALLSFSIINVYWIGVVFYGTGTCRGYCSADLIMRAVSNGCQAYEVGSAESGQLTQKPCVLMCSLFLFGLTLMGCFASFTTLGSEGFSHCQSHRCDEIRPLLITLVIGTVLTLITAIIGLTALCRFGNCSPANSTNRGHRVDPFATRNALTNHTLQMVTVLQRQNELLQQQLFSQQQLQQQQQYQQQQLDWYFPRQQPPTDK